jgi:predicted phosphodiesterase
MTKKALCFACLFLVAFAAAAADPSVKATVDSIADRLHDALTEDQLIALDEATLEKFVTPEDKAVLATRHWQFDVDVPAVVYVMREMSQPTTPFWLPEAGFQKTEMTINANEGDMKFEVWRKNFDPGRVGLGINGFDKHRPHYFVAVKPQTAGAKLAISNPCPEWQEVHELKPGAFFYHDWSELGVAAVPEEMVGAVILPTMRGRAREAHFIGGFRKTAYPASNTPDQIALTPNDESPADSMAVQWRTAPSVEAGAARFRAKGETEWLAVEATRAQVEDKFIVNDRSVARFTAVMENLKPGAEYEYEIGGGNRDWLSQSSFRTAPDPGTPFAFAFLSDTHNKPESEALLAKASQLYPQLSFVTISGDLVGTGQYRDDWDTLFNLAGSYFNRIPVAPAIGNHDGIDGLGVDLYLALFDLPENGPASLQPERAYSFRYGNARFIMPDVISPIAGQTAWLEEQLRDAKETWKFVVFHFPPYSPGITEPEIVKEWVPLFDKYHADFVFSGHVHHYVRTHPIKAGEVQSSPNDGTIYVVTVSVAGRDRPPRSHPLAAVMKNSADALCNIFTVDNDTVTMKTIDAQGNVHDEIVVKK